MEPIISPWLIYFINISENVQVTLVFFIAFILIFGFVGLLAHANENIKIKKWQFRLYLISVILLISIATLIPSKSTMIQMLVAKNITYDNVGKIVDTGKNVKDELKKDIIDIIQSFEKKKTNDKH